MCECVCCGTSNRLHTVIHCSLESSAKKLYDQGGGVVIIHLVVPVHVYDVRGYKACRRPVSHNTNLLLQAAANISVQHYISEPKNGNLSILFPRLIQTPSRRVQYGDVHAVGQVHFLADCFVVSFNCAEAHCSCCCLKQKISIM